jgi:hypothetical protein
MHKTHHAQKRMAQRGIGRDMVEYVMSNGIPERDRVIMGRKEALRMLEALQEEQRLIKKILDKGGVVVVAEGNTVITTYNCKNRPH